MIGTIASPGIRADLLARIDALKARRKSGLWGGDSFAAIEQGAARFGVDVEAEIAAAAGASRRGRRRPAGPQVRPGAKAPSYEEAVAGALGNLDLQHYFTLNQPGFPTEAGQRRFPTVKLVFEHAWVIGHAGEAWAAARSKTTFGDLLGIEPLQPEDPVDPRRVLFIYQKANRFNARVEQRKAMRKRLGSKAAAKLVNRAWRRTKGRFLAGLAEAEAATIRRTFGVEPGTFWRLAKGKEFADMGPRDQQRDLF